MRFPEKRESLEQKSTFFVIYNIALYYFILSCKLKNICVQNTSKHFEVKQMNANRYLIGISKLENYLLYPFDLTTNIDNHC